MKLLNNIKLRFRKSLFAFFKAEIMSEARWNNEIVTEKVVCKSVNFTQIHAEILLERPTNRETLYDPPFVVYEKALEQCKHNLFEAAMKHIVIDSRSIMDSNIHEARAIRVSLFVGDIER